MTNFNPNDVNFPELPDGYHWSVETVDWNHLRVKVSIMQRNPNPGSVSVWQKLLGKRDQPLFLSVLSDDTSVADGVTTVQCLVDRLNFTFTLTQETQ